MVVTKISERESELCEKLCAEISLWNQLRRKSELPVPVIFAQMGILLIDFRNDSGKCHDAPHATLDQYEYGEHENEVQNDVR